LIGVVLVWFPVLFPIFTSIDRFLISKRWLFDYLIPAELFPLVFTGGILLFIAAYKSGRYKRQVTWTLVLMLTTLVLGQVVAVLTGLASGKTEPTGLPWLTVLSFIGGYVLTVIYLGVIGLRLLMSEKEIKNNK
jgi:hypothetical protein